MTEHEIDCNCDVCQLANDVVAADIADQFAGRCKTLLAQVEQLTKDRDEWKHQFDAEAEIGNRYDAECCALRARVSELETELAAASPVPRRCECGNTTDFELNHDPNRGWWMQCGNCARGEGTKTPHAPTPAAAIRAWNEAGDAGEVDVPKAPENRDELLDTIIASLLKLQLHHSKPEPCPCGCGAERAVRKHNYLGFKVQSDCGAAGPWSETETEAVAAWNRAARKGEEHGLHD